MEKFNNIFFTLMAHGPEADISEVSGKEQIEAQPAKKEGEGSNSVYFFMRTIQRNICF
ncbi:signal recognition particle 9 kDa protein [Phtheirospermum japonicum]|uniref:Signal recognition particle 9 kDa protein n=1 Tax=Phtheirospermum japonicum TaxID=374723 RepID=A0A830D9K5_9LAMI|nr:signal recognition particle 9 kDa protein [Phtheirospermum japonicum]